MTAQFAASRFPASFRPTQCGSAAPTEGGDDIAGASKSSGLPPASRARDSVGFVKVDKVLGLQQARWLRRWTTGRLWQAQRLAPLQLTEAAHDAQVQTDQLGGGVPRGTYQCFRAVAEIIAVQRRRSPLPGHDDQETRSSTSTPRSRWRHRQSANSQFNVDTAVKIADAATKNSQFNASATMNCWRQDQQTAL